MLAAHRCASPGSDVARFDERRERTTGFHHRLDHCVHIGGHGCPNGSLPSRRGCSACGRRAAAPNPTTRSTVEASTDRAARARRASSVVANADADVGATRSCGRATTASGGSVVAVLVVAVCPPRRRRRAAWRARHCRCMRTSRRRCRRRTRRARALSQSSQRSRDHDGKRSRRSCLRILPIGLRGIASIISTRSGTFCVARPTLVQ